MMLCEQGAALLAQSQGSEDQEEPAFLCMCIVFMNKSIHESWTWKDVHFATGANLCRFGLHVPVVRSVPFTCAQFILDLFLSPQSTQA